MSNIEVVKYLFLCKGSVYIDGNRIYTASAYLTFNETMKSIYKEFEINYSKFYKMSQLCKLGFIASELLLKETDINLTRGEEVAVVLANASASLQADIVYQASIEDAPSPSLFVYTLPNIVNGEICIRNGFKGENAFFIQSQFDASFIEKYVSHIFNSTNSSMCLCGWIEMLNDNVYEAFLVLVKRDDADKIEILEDLYSRIKC